ncbi:o-succinylbenzoate synthase [Trichocoleus sp. ST-U3]|uniref:o-succinylbenzoate synthase n=1 Tax=Coleofasciculus sp. FACHB-542 TaxID=2692787 RepID=UPI0016843B17|nr:o-succinylbenzoate synthase [Coleofasciculus sp. FACHB-542]MBD2088189.1 o-succinylbenzoate synthase [Coleofasciculus sp. FACHB-542]
MQYRFEFCPYRRRFVRPLQTSHGIWDIREGIILRLTDENGQVGWGEIAPLSWFGSETLEQALSFCRQQPQEITTETIFSIPSALPACQFGFESAWEDISHFQDKANLTPQPPFPAGDGGELKASLQPPFLRGERGDREGLGERFSESLTREYAYSGLLPTGEAALNQWQTLWNQGYRTFKWKIGVYPIADELKIFQRLTQTLPEGVKLRLDANGGLSYEEANLWLWTCDNVKAEELPVEIEFLEQPLSVAQFQGMAELSMCYATAIALDESVATIDQMEAAYRDGWRGIFVIKPCIAGSPSRLRQFCQQHEIDAVFSSVFETAIGRQAALKLAAELSRHNRAVGFGINHWFDEDEEIRFKN